VTPGGCCRTKPQSSVGKHLAQPAGQTPEILTLRLRTFTGIAGRANPQTVETARQTHLACALRADPCVAHFSGGIHQDSKEMQMNWDRFEGNWKQFKGKAKQQWGKLTDDQLDVIDGKREQLAGKIQEQYGITKDEAEKQIVEFEKRYEDWNPRH